MHKTNKNKSGMPIVFAHYFLFFGLLKVKNSGMHFLEDPNLPELRSLGSSCPFLLSDNRFWGQ